MKNFLPFLAIASILMSPLELIAQTWGQLNVLTPLSEATNSSFGEKMDSDGIYTVVGAKGGNGFIGLAYVLKLEAEGWTEHQVLEAPDGAPGDQFGFAVAIHGDYIVVAAPESDLDENGENFVAAAGSAYIFHLEGDTWEFQQKIVASERTLFDNAGKAVAIYEDYIVLTALGEDEDVNGENTLNAAGAAYIFKREGEVWTQQQKIVSSDRDTFDSFGKSVAIEGEFLAIAADQEDEDADGQNTVLSAGSVYMFKLENDIWEEYQKIVVLDRAQGDRIGNDMSISGNYLVVAASSKNLGNGATYVFMLEDETWSQQQKVESSDLSQNDFFGQSVCIIEDEIIVGAHFEDHDENGENMLPSSGSAYIFKRIDEVWSETQKIVAENRVSSQQFGVSVAFGGGDILVGTPKYNTESIGVTGGVFVFDRCGSLSIDVEYPEAICSGSSLTLMALSNGESINWYANETDVEPIFSGSEYTISNVTQSTSYWVDSNLEECVTSRFEVLVEVNPLPALEVLETEVEICVGEIALMNASSTDGQILWYDEEFAENQVYSGSAFAVPNLLETTSFWVESKIAATGCASQLVEVTVVVHEIPDAPTAIAMQELLTGGMLSELDVEAFGELRWYTDENLNFMVESSTQPKNGSTYYVTQIANGCESEATPITINLVLGLIDLGEDRITWFPNPTRNVMQIVSENYTIQSVELYTVTGNLIWSNLSVNALKTQVDMTAFPSGLYIVNMVTSNRASSFRILKD